MKNLEISISDLVQLPDAAKNILRFSEERKIFAFYAGMGAGKTTLIKELCRQLGSSDNFSSPTYNIVNEYLISSSVTGHPSSVSRIYHIDLYRLNKIEETYAIGVVEYLNSGNYCFIEWPQLLETLLPDDTVKIFIQSDGNIRNVSIFTN